MPNLPRLLLATLLVLPLVTAVGVTRGTATTVEAVTTSAPSFVVDGQVAEPLTLTVDDLRNFAVQRQKVHFVSGSGKEAHRYRGALLIDVLTSAKPQDRKSVV